MIREKELMKIKNGLSLGLSLSLGFSLATILGASTMNKSLAEETKSTNNKVKQEKLGAKSSGKGEDKLKEKSSDKSEKEKSSKDKTEASKDKEEDKSKTTSNKPEPVIENLLSVQAEDLVDKPHEYMGKNVKFVSNFYAFSTLALDYKPAFRSSKTHISFMVLRNKKHLPLSELKLAMMVPKEKDPDTQLLATLKDGDSIEIVGKVFSAALDDPWVEVLKLKKLGGDDKKSENSNKAKQGDGKDSKDTKDSKDNSETKTESKPETKSDKSSNKTKEDTKSNSKN